MQNAIDNYSNNCETKSGDQNLTLYSTKSNLLIINHIQLFIQYISCTISSKAFDPLKNPKVLSSPYVKYATAPAIKGLKQYCYLIKKSFLECLT